MPKIVWDKGSDRDQGRRSDYRESGNSYRDKNVHRREKNKNKPFNIRDKQSKPHRRDNLNNSVRLQHLVNDPHDDVGEDTEFMGRKRNSTDSSTGMRRLNPGLLAGLKGLVECHEEQNARKKEVKVQSVASKREPETKARARENNLASAGRKVIEFGENNQNNGDCVLNEEENVETKNINKRKFLFETTVETCPSESSCSPIIYEDPSVRLKEDESNWKRTKDSKRSKKKKGKNQDYCRVKSPKKKRRKRSCSSSSSSSSSESDWEEREREEEEDLKEINRQREGLLKMREALSRNSSSSSVSLSPDMEELLSKEKEKSRLDERRKKRTPITPPDLEPARVPVKMRLGSITVNDSLDSRRNPEEDRSKTRDSRERQFSKGRNSRARLSRTPERNSQERRVSITSEPRKEVRRSEHGSEKRKRRASSPDSERDKDKLLNKVRQLRTNSKCEKKEAVKSREEGCASAVETQGAPAVVREGWRCEECGEPGAHLVEQCPDSEANGNNPRDPFGGRDQCNQCSSFNHLSADCRHSKENGSNQEGQGGKFQCRLCMSYDHLTQHCQRIHSKKLGKNRTGIGGKKLSCDICNSFHHQREDHNQVTDCCHHCGRFDHATDRCPEITTRTVKFVPEDTEDFQRRPLYAAVSSEEEKILQKEAEGKMLARLKSKAEGRGSLIKRSNFSEAASTSKEPVNPLGEEEPAQPTFDIFKDEDLRTDKTKQPKISNKMHEEITAALQGDRLVVEDFKIKIQTSDLFGLTGENWLNDNVIEFYMKLIAERSMTEAYRREKLPTVYAMSTYFFQHLMVRGPNAVKRWNKNVNIFDFDLILVPIHQEEHWCLATVDFRSPGVFYYDSMGGHNMPALSLILEYLQVEHLNKRNAVLDIKRYVKEIVEDCPQQENGADCGIFACKAAEFLSRDETLKFSQQDMQFYRKLMVYEIAKKRLLIDQP